MVTGLILMEWRGRFSTVRTKNLNDVTVGKMALAKITQNTYVTAIYDLNIQRRIMELSALIGYFRSKNFNINFWDIHWILLIQLMDQQLLQLEILYAKVTFKINFCSKLKKISVQFKTTIRIDVIKSVFTESMVKKFLKTSCCCCSNSLMYPKYHYFQIIFISKSKATWKTWIAKSRKFIGIPGRKGFIVSLTFLFNHLVLQSVP